MNDPKHETGSVEVVKPSESPAPSSTFQKPAPSAMAAATAPTVVDTQEPFVQLTSMGSSLYALDRGGRVWAMEIPGSRLLPQEWRPLPTDREQT
jgi:hypothetical protein